MDSISYIYRDFEKSAGFSVGEDVDAKKNTMKRITYKFLGMGVRGLWIPKKWWILWVEFF